MKIIPSVTVEVNEKKGAKTRHPANKVVDLNDDQAKELIERGFAVSAEPVAEATKGTEGK